MSRRAAPVVLRIAILIILAVIAARAADSATDVLEAVLLFLPAIAVLVAIVVALERSARLRRFAGIGWLLGFDLAAIALAIPTLGEAARPELLAFLMLALVVATARDLVSGALAGVLAGSGYGYLALVRDEQYAPVEVSVRAAVYVAAGLLVGLLSSEADVERAEAKALTDQLERELADLAVHLKNVLASVASGVIAVGTDGRVTTYNRAAERILGVPGHRVTGRALGEVATLAPLAELIGAPPLIDGGATASGLARADRRADVELARQDGSRVKIGYATTPLEDVAGRRLGAILVFQDVTLIRDYEERMLRQETLAALGRLVSGIAHEFGNVLGGARGHVDFALKDGTADESRAALEVVRGTLERAIATIGHLLRFARGTPLDRKPGVVVAEVVDRALYLTSRELDAAGVAVTKSFANAPPISADAAQLEQVFINIIINARQAVEAAPKKSIHVAITAAKNGAVEVAFDDSGPGVPPTIRDKVFEPFFTTKGALGGSPTPGTGLGLSVALGIVEAHDGTIDVESSPNLGGARFIVRLPSTGGDVTAKAT